MAEVGRSAVIYRFGVFEADVDAGELRKNGVKLKLQEQPFQVLTALLERAGILVTREELRDRVWPQDTFVDFDHAVNTAITKIRLVLADDAENPRFVETIPRRGYRFIAPVDGNHISRSAQLPAQENIDLDVRTETQRRQHRVFLWIAVPLAVLLAAGVYITRRKDGSNPSFERQTFDRGTIYNARFTPDGNTIVYGAAWDGKPSQIFWTRPGSRTSSPLGPPNADVLAISARGEIAAQLNQHTLAAGSIRVGTLALLPLSGGTPREILENVGGADFSPDGENLAVVHWVQDRSRCRLEFPIGKVLYESDYTSVGWVSSPRISPRGDQIAFLDHPLSADQGGSVAVIDLVGRKTVLSQNWITTQGLAWSSDGKEIWFSGAGPGGKGIYAVTPSGKERLILREPETLALSDLSPEGRLLGIHSNEHAECRVRLSGDTKERDFTWLGSSGCDAISSDGKTVLMEAFEGQNALAIHQVYIRRGETPSAVRVGDGYGLALSPDGKWALSLVEQLPDKLVLLPTGPGESKILPRGSIEHYDPVGAKWLPDNRRILFVGRERGHELRAYLQDIDGGEPRAITPERRFSYMPPGLAVSPDGSSVIFTTGDEEKFFAYPIDKGEPRVIAGLKQGDWPIEWSADGRSLFVTRRGIAPSKVYVVNLHTGERRLWKTFMPPDPAGVDAVDPVLTPDGQFHAYSYVRNLSELYSVDGVK